jgi:hypothetical protein
MPSTNELLTVWEQGHRATPPRRALHLLAALLPDQPPEQLAATPVGQCEDLLLELREHLFGSRLSATADCPACHETVELTFHAATLRNGAPHNKRADSLEDRTVHCAGHVVRFRLPHAGDLLRLESEPDVASAARMLLDACILSAERDGQPVATRQLPKEVVATVTTHMAEHDPRSNHQIALDCPACGHHWEVLFDAGSFLWSELGAWARRLLHEVHSLARAYGWSESEILTLSPARRQAYLELIGS